MCAEGREGDIPQESNSPFGTNVTMTFLPCGARRAQHYASRRQRRFEANGRSAKQQTELTLRGRAAE
jgi:hypothetical protein